MYSNLKQKKRKGKKETTRAFRHPTKLNHTTPKKRGGGKKKGGREGTCYDHHDLPRKRKGEKKKKGKKKVGEPTPILILLTTRGKRKKEKKGINAGGEFFSISSTQKE